MFKFIVMLACISTLSIGNDALEGFQTTDLRSKAELDQAFKLTRKNGGSQCFERAHFWSYQLYRQKGYNTQKAYIFFSARYKRLIHGAWWFHVAPAIKMQGDLYVMDNEFLRKAVTFEAWKNGCIDHGVRKLTLMKKRLDSEKARIHGELSRSSLTSSRETYLKNRLAAIRDKEEKYLIADAKLVPATAQNWPWNNTKEIIDLECPEITNYSQYKALGEQYHCFIYHTSMYYFEPRDIEKLETTGETRSEWKRSEVINSFHRAFKGKFPFQFE